MVGVIGKLKVWYVCCGRGRFVDTVVWRRMISVVIYFIPVEYLSRVVRQGESKQV